MDEPLAGGEFECKDDIVGCIPGDRPALELQKPRFHERDHMIKTLIRLSAVLAGALAFPGCEKAPGPTSTNLTFNIVRLPSTPDGRPVVDVKPLSQHQLAQANAGASVRYILMVRRNGAAYYIRWFYANDVVNGLQRDLAIPPNEVMPGDKLTVDVEVVNPRNPTDYVLLSNVLDLSDPPPQLPPSTTPDPNADS